MVLCKELPEKYIAPSTYLFNEDCPFKSAEIDLEMLRVFNEVEKELMDEDRDKAEKPADPVSSEDTEFENPFKSRSGVQTA